MFEIYSIEGSVLLGSIRQRISSVSLTAVRGLSASKMLSSLKNAPLTVLTRSLRMISNQISLGKGDRAGRLLTLAILVRLAHATYLTNAATKHDSFGSRNDFGRQASLNNLFDRLSSIDLSKLFDSQGSQHDKTKLARFLESHGEAILRDLNWSWDRPSAVDHKRNRLLKQRDRILINNGFLTKSSSLGSTLGDVDTLFKRSASSKVILNSMYYSAARGGSSQIDIEQMIKVVDLSVTAFLSHSLAVVTHASDGSTVIKDIDAMADKDIKFGEACLRLCGKASLLLPYQHVHLSTFKRLFNIIKLQI